ncbi:MAG: succinate dehydrogenase, hydrophobic membrane anchor protein [Gammaproteobacteria bacterium]|nr:succinate dehydrogenase, hydrophobic membrane anchor protein [Gammaproteobacteria bacterium]MBT8149903.1 succinate dehydrogenase, hydrophobic membrane anchor protein [Gammaproteobacteria bacterium]NND38707.1 succinate dehydrogenase, hydrophobic membrane anchor protein [Pseudomonadales bacterium]NNL11956.1 succinate dehydrogenase, hydrophobic membrane anchor protein [Pseudomonadales bacterium]NNM10712.1 succinate dehydrogenase, hydrophobic membrane anchor protein [Pseudomonadales bacterium]
MGVKEWLFQRTSNLLFVVFGLCLLVALLRGASIASLDEWLAGGSSRIFLIVVWVFACFNSVLAGWQIAGDYAPKVGLSVNLVSGIIALVSLAFLVLGLQIIL